MQLDNTRIAIRERGLLEILDLTLVVIGDFAGPLCVSFLAVVLPLLALNYFLIGWMAEPGLDDEFPIRYVWTSFLLIFLEAPLVSLFLVSYLGPALFLQKLSWRQVVRDTFAFFPHLFWSVLVLRGILPAWLLCLTLDRDSVNPFVEGLLLPGLCCYAALVRALRPYIIEIILLERNPLRARDERTMTVGRRSAFFHGPSAADLFVRWLGSAAIALLLGGMFLGTLYSASGVLVSDWGFDAWKLQFLYPWPLWLVAGFFAVARFLSYLDLRIRHEGWEVELLMKAEAARLTSKLA